jgi:antitoxin YefM
MRSLRSQVPLVVSQNLAILIAMSMLEQMPLAEVKNRLSEVVDEVEREHARVVITKHGRPAAVVVSTADLESLEETLDIMGNESLLADIKEAIMELSAGAAVPLTKDEALRLITGS